MPPRTDSRLPCPGPAWAWPPAPGRGDCFAPLFVGKRNKQPGSRLGVRWGQGQLLGKPVKVSGRGPNLGDTLEPGRSRVCPVCNSGGKQLPDTQEEPTNQVLGP